MHWFTPEEHKELDSLPAEERDKKVQEINRKLYAENDAQRRVELFDALAKAVELDEAVTRNAEKH